MKNAENRFAAIEFRRTRREDECWRITRIGAPRPPVPVRHRRDPANSRVLPRWLDRLADRDRPSPYRVAPVGGRRAE